MDNTFHYLADLGQILMDLFYQDYRPADAFLKIHHFNYIAGACYLRILEDEYKENRIVSKQETGDTEIILSGDWLINEVGEVKDNKLTLSHRPVSFPFDKMGYSIQEIRSVEGRCRDYIRTASTTIWKFNRMPYTDKAFYYLKDGTIHFICKCHSSKVSVSYIPDISDPTFGENGGIVPATKRELIFTRALLLFQQAANGNVVDMTNNGNPNKALQTEIDNVFQGIRTKQ